MHIDDMTREQLIEFLVDLGYDEAEMKTMNEDELHHIATEEQQ